MVVKGNFSLRLVEAESKIPFPEHTGPDGKAYQEVEPQAEYLIKVKIRHNSSTPKLPPHIRIYHEVDGQKLRYYKNISTNRTAPYRYYSGIRRVDEYGVSSHQALRFEVPTLIPSSSSSSSSSPAQRPSLGTVTIHVYEGIATMVTPSEGKENTKRRSSTVCIDAGEISAQCLTGGEKKKVLRSSAGSFVEKKSGKNFENKRRNKRRILDDESLGPKTVYKTGPLLDTLTIHYCTALGLVQAGVFGGPTKDDTSNNNGQVQGAKKKKEIVEFESQSVAPLTQATIGASLGESQDEIEGKDESIAGDEEVEKKPAKRIKVEAPIFSQATANKNDDIVDLTGLSDDE